MARMITSLLALQLCLSVWYFSIMSEQASHWHTMLLIATNRSDEETPCRNGVTDSRCGRPAGSSYLTEGGTGYLKVVLQETRMIFNSEIN